MRALLLAVTVLACAAGCPPREQQAAPTDGGAKLGGCATFGQSCEVSPGKLGTCVKKDDCAEPGGCFVCQSQH